MAGSDPVGDTFALFVELQPFVAWFAGRIVRLGWPSFIIPLSLCT